MKLQAYVFHFENQPSAGLAVAYIPLSEVWIGGFKPPRTLYHAYCNMSSCCSQLHMLHRLIRDPNSFTCAILPANIMLSHVNTTNPQRPLSDLPRSVSCLLTHLSVWKPSCSVSCLQTSLWNPPLLFLVSWRLSVRNPPVVSCLISLFAILLFCFLYPITHPPIHNPPVPQPTWCSDQEERTIERYFSSPVSPT